MAESIDKWINAKEKKPNTYEDVLVLFEYENYGKDFATSLKIGVAHYVMGKWYGDDLYKYPKSKVIYWQPYEMCISECREGYDAQIAEYKRLLKAAVEDIYKARQGCNCNICDMPPEPTERCQYENGEDCQFKWRYTDEALKLIES